MLIKLVEMDPLTNEGYMTQIIDPSNIANSFRDEIRVRVIEIAKPLKLVGFLASEAGPSRTYASYTQAGCDAVGIGFDLRVVPKLDIERAIDQANSDPSVHGILVYYPIFAGEHDGYIKDLVDHRKDIEGLNTFWAKKLYHNERFVDESLRKKAILPCTPLAIVKLITHTLGTVYHGVNVSGKQITIFNRSEVVGRPLASMLANDGARVISFDVDGPLLFTKAGIEEITISRQEALKDSDIVVTGVPSRSFPLVSAREIRDGVLCVNFSTLKNFDDDIHGKAGAFIPRVGPMTVTMALRNTLRLYDNYVART